MAKNGNNTKNTRHISKIFYSVINGEQFNFPKTVWCEGGLKLSDIGKKNVRGDELNPRLGYSMVRLYN